MIVSKRRAVGSSFDRLLNDRESESAVALINAQYMKAFYRLTELVSMSRTFRLDRSHVPFMVHFFQARLLSPKESKREYMRKGKALETKKGE